jgi:hypothetical protein
MKHLRIYSIILLFIVSSIGLAQVPPMSVEDELYASVLSIEGKTHIGRGEYIKEQLHKLGVGYVVAPFKQVTVHGSDTLIIEGENIIARLGNGTKRIVVGAHYDAVPDSPGANDNGSGVSVMLALLKHLQDSSWNYSLDFCFFDQEEAGSIGAQYYIKQFIVPKRHLAMINLDIEGTGEELFVGPTGNNTRLIMRYVREAAQKIHAPMVEKNKYPGSDHEPFIKLGLETISISVVPRGDGERLSNWVQNGYKADPAHLPKVMDVMHTQNDRSNLVTPEALKLSFEFTKTLLLLLNDSKR